MSRGSRVLVGYDGTVESEAALRWAVEEARLRRLPLMVCHAWRWPYPRTYFHAEGAAIVRRMGENLLAHGVSLAREMAAGVEVHEHLMDGPAHSALMHEAHDAAVIVIGSHEQRDLPLGSTALQLPARADRPVMVVRAAGPHPAQLDRALVVAGVDGSAGADAALWLAFEEAALRGWPLRAVSGVWEPGAAEEGDLSLFGDEDELRRVFGERLERAVAPWRVKYPDVDATTLLRVESPRAALMDAACEAALVVVGGQGAGRHDASGLGTTSGALLQNAPCTLAVVQPAHMDGASGVFQRSRSS